MQMEALPPAQYTHLIPNHMCLWSLASYIKRPRGYLTYSTCFSSTFGSVPTWEENGMDWEAEYISLASWY